MRFANVLLIGTRTAIIIRAIILKFAFMQRGVTCCELTHRRVIGEPNLFARNERSIPNKVKHCCYRHIDNFFLVLNTDKNIFAIEYRERKREKGERFPLL